MGTKVAKTIVRHGLVVALEGSYDEGYGTTNPDSATDGVEPEGPIEVPPDYAFGGERDTGAGAGTGTLRRGAASGRFGAISIPSLFRGPGSAYALAGDLELNALLQACGHVATVDLTAGSETIEYAPTTDLANLASIAAGFYTRGQLAKATGGLGSLKAELNDQGFLLFTFDFSFKLADPFTDVARPSITLQSGIHPTATNIGIQIGNYVAILRSFAFDQGRQVAGRNDYGGGGHAGFAPGIVEPRVTMTIEAPALAASTPWHTATEFDPDRFYEDAIEAAIDATFGGTQYNQVGFNAPQAQLISPPSPSNDGPTATWDLEFQLPPSAPAADDHYTWTAK